MVKKCSDFLAGVPATVVSGVFLVGSFVLPPMGFGQAAYLAWVSILISGIPLVYLAIHRIIHNPGISKISSALLISIAMVAAIAIGDVFAAGEVAFIMALGAILEDMTTNRARKGLQNLLRLAPTQGRRIVEGKEILCGNQNFLEEQGVILETASLALLEQLCAQGKAAILVAQEKTCIGIIGLSDVLRPDAKEVVEKLAAMNTRSVLLTGDNQQTARHFAAQMGITEVYAQLLPEQKVENILSLQQKGKTICMIGDGVNDAPALKSAHVGVAMGSMGSDISVEAADIALMSDDISKIPYLKWLSNATVATITLSITLSMCINFLAVFLSVLGVLNPTTGALVHNAGSCFVVLIAALLYDRKYQ